MLSVQEERIHFVLHHASNVEKKTNPKVPKSEYFLTSSYSSMRDFCLTELKTYIHGRRHSKQSED